MGNITTLLCGIGLIIWGFVPLNGKPAPTTYTIITSIIGTILIAFAIYFFIRDRKKNNQ
jgi:hypothetical protein